MESNEDRYTFTNSVLGLECASELVRALREAGFTTRYEREEFKGFVLLIVIATSTRPTRRERGLSA